jgi:phage tail tube protein FII
MPQQIFPSSYTFAGDGDIDCQFIGSDANPASINGVATNIKIPALERDVDNDMRIGEPGEVNRPTKFKAMQATVMLKGLTDSIDLTTFASLSGNCTLQAVMTGVNNFDATDKATITYILKGPLLKWPSDADIKPGENTEFEVIMGVNSFEKRFKNRTFVFDVARRSWKVNTTEYLT